MQLWHKAFGDRWVKLKKWSQRVFLFSPSPRMILSCRHWAPLCKTKPNKQKRITTVASSSSLMMICSFSYWSFRRWICISLVTMASMLHKGRFYPEFIASGPPAATVTLEWGLIRSRSQHVCPGTRTSKSHALQWVLKGSWTTLFIKYPRVITGQNVTNSASILLTL